MALIDIVRDAAIELGLSPPSVAVSSNDQTDIELVYFANRALADVAQWHDWSLLSKPGSITGDGVATEWAVPADFARLAKSQRMQLQGGGVYALAGPLNDADLVDARTRNLTIYPAFFFRGGKICTTSPLAAGRTALYEYQAIAAKMTADASACPLPEPLVREGLIWMWKRSKGLDYTQEYATYRENVQLEAARDQSRQPVAMSPRLDLPLPDPSIPETIVVL